MRIESNRKRFATVYNKVSQKYASAAQVAGISQRLTRRSTSCVCVLRMKSKRSFAAKFCRKVQQAIRGKRFHPLGRTASASGRFGKFKIKRLAADFLNVHVEVMPEIPTPEYKNLEAVRAACVRFADEELERIIDERRQEASATLIPVEDRKSQEGDTVIVDLEGTFADEPEAEPIKADDLEIHARRRNRSKNLLRKI
jgi:hypothetical protein